VSLSTVRQDIAAIRWMHSRHGCDDPTQHAGVQRILDGINQTKRGDGRKPKRAVLTKHVRAMVEAVRTDDSGTDAGCVARNRYLRGLRDAALLLVGYAGAMRRSGLASITFDDLTLNEQGVEVHLLKTKTESRTVGINRAETPDFCPVRASAVD
jgi:integrase